MNEQERCLRPALAVGLLLVPWLTAVLEANLEASDLDEFKVKREAVFEFAQKPVVTRSGDRVTIRFETRAFCDATVAIEAEKGRIVRHLASGVLGPTAPEPFQKDSKKQTLIWDGKDDQGRYIDEKDRLTVRVSLGLEGRFERTLFWSPHKRVGPQYPVIRAAEEGVYLAEGFAVDHLRLFDHKGNFLRTVYPFPRDNLQEVVGLKTHTFVQNGQTLPLKGGYHQATLLTCGSNSDLGGDAEGFGVSAMDVRNGRLALVHLRLNRLRSDATSGGMPLNGALTGIHIPERGSGWGSVIGGDVGPLSAALSPDGKSVYVTGYQFSTRGTAQRGWLNGVGRIAYEGDAAMTTFAGTLEPKQTPGGAADGQFRVPTSVACDAQGRIYVADYMNDRIQVFDADGKHLKNIAVSKPASVAVHRRTGDIFVFSWFLANRFIGAGRVEPVYTHLCPFDDPQVKVTCPLPLTAHAPHGDFNYTGGLQHRVELDSWTEKPTVWIVNGQVARTVTRDDVKKSVTRVMPPTLWRQRLYVNPATGLVYVAEGDAGVRKAVNQLVELDPETGRIALLDLPFGAEDLCFGPDGLAYLRTDTLVARYDSKTWKEVPWDYGEERDAKYNYDAKGAALTAGLVTPGHRSFNFWHLGGIDVSFRNRLVVTTCNGASMKGIPAWRAGEARFDYKSDYVPPAYPGRMRWGEIHVYDERGRILHKDAVPGMGHLNGIGIDRDDNLYMLLAARRLIDGKPLDPALPRDVSGTLVKVAADKAKVLSSGAAAALPLPAEAQPKRPPDFTGIAFVGFTSGWIEGADWFYGGVGFSTPRGCVCWNSRFDLDYFNRSFAPEPLLYSVAVLDSSGNLILRIGKYGNVEDGAPLVEAGGPARPHSIGGDEVALVHACYVAAHTDRRLFIADAGNARILSVTLNYHATERVLLKDISDTK